MRSFRAQASSAKHSLASSAKHSLSLGAQGAAMPSLDQSAERIIDIAHTRGSGSARIAVMTADAYLMAFGASQIDKERARLIAVLEEKGPGT